MCNGETKGDAPRANAMPHGNVSLADWDNRVPLPSERHGKHLELALSLPIERHVWQADRGQLKGQIYQLPIRTSLAAVEQGR